MDSIPTKKERLPLLSKWIILIVVFISFSPVLKNGFLSWDDPQHILNNISIQDLKMSNIGQIFTSYVQKIYIPLTALTFALEKKVFGFNPFVVHLDNLLLHLIVVWSIFTFGRQCGLSSKATAVAALIFGIHPIHVESVAWATERKDVLYAVFYMLALIHYFRYIDTGQKKFYWGTVLFGLFSMLSKPMALSLPLVLFLLDWYRKRKMELSVWIEKVPFFTYIIPIMLMTYFKNPRIPMGNPYESVLILMWCATFYIKKFFWPFHFYPLYDLPEPIALTNVSYASSVLLFIFLMGLLWFKRQKKILIFAFIFYLSTIFMLLKYANRADLVVYAVADRFMYLPSLGFCLFLGQLSDEFLLSASFVSKKIRTWILSGLAAIVVFLSVQTFNQCRIWKDTITFWTYQIHHLPDVVLPYGERGREYLAQGKYQLALSDFNTALKLDPTMAEVYTNRAVLFNSMGSDELALEDLNRALSYNPKESEALNNRGNLLQKTRRYDLALKDINLAIQNKEHFYEAYNNRGVLFARLNKADLALADFNEAVKINPYYADAYFNRALIYSQKQEYDKAIPDLTKAIKLKPGFTQAYTDRGNIFYLKKEYQKAVDDYSLALQQGEPKTSLYYARAAAFQALNLIDQAGQDIRRAQALEAEWEQDPSR